MNEKEVDAVVPLETVENSQEPYVIRKKRVGKIEKSMWKSS